MKHEVFKNDSKQTFVVIIDWEGKKPNKEEAIKYAANNVFKCKKNLLTTIDCYMTNKDDDTVFFHYKKGTHKFIGICRSSVL